MVRALEFRDRVLELIGVLRVSIRVLGLGLKLRFSGFRVGVRI